MDFTDFIVKALKIDMSLIVQYTNKDKQVC